jgi:CubicO group peptidase (beta-lactamase class C family)
MHRSHLTQRIAAAAMISLLVLPVNVSAGEPPTLPERLDRLVELLEDQRQAFHIPGMSIAVLKDDQVVLLRGFGVADVDSQEPVTEDTLFAAGSTTKAFTAALIGILVDDGVMSWDDPVSDHLAAFHLADPAADEQVAIRDLLCHRVGLATMSIAWYGNDVGRQELLELVPRAELLYPFRERFNYSNISFLAAGEAAGRAAGTDWDGLLASRILGPLGMSGANSSYAAAQANPRMASGYRWYEQRKELRHQPMRRVDAVAPAGSINASARDMAQWVRFQLGRGSHGEQRLLSEEQHAQTWTEHTEVSPGIGYGLGWFLRDRRGQLVVEHAGGIDGFTAEVALLPDEQVGFALLMNLFASPLQEASRRIVFDTLLDDWTEQGAVVAEDFSPLLGTYVGNFGQFQDAEFEVLQRDGKLALDVPGQMVFELLPPDETGRRTFAMTDQVAVQFNHAEDGPARSLTIFQAGMAFELPRQGVEMPLEIDLDDARRFLGRYHSEQLDANLRVLIQNNRLAIDVPGQMIYELHAPDEEERWVFRVRDTIWARFEADDQGRITAMAMTQDGEESTLPRVGEPESDEAELPSVAELMQRVHEACGGTRLDGLRSFRAEGSVELVHIGLSGRTTMQATTTGQLRSTLDLGRHATVRTIVDGDHGQLDASFMNETLEGEYLEQARLESPLLWLADWREVFDDVQVLGRSELDGKPVYEVRLRPHLGPALTVMIDVDSGLPVGRRMSTLAATGMRVPVTVRLEDYREVGGAMLAHRIVTENALSGRMVVRYEVVELNGETEGVGD